MISVAGDVGKSNIRLAVFADGIPHRSVELPSPAALGQESGADALFAAIAEAIGRLETGGEPVELGIGVAGVARSAVSVDALAAAIGHVALIERLVLASDVVVAHLSAFDGGEGTVLVVGTGSAALNLEVGHPPLLRDGDGPRFGDDGSGGWMGACAVRAVVHAVEDRGPRTSLQESLAERSGLDAHAMIREGNEAENPARWAGRFAPDVLAAWEAGDFVASGIVSEAISALAATVLAARRKSAEVRLTGGVTRHPAFSAALAATLSSAAPELTIAASEATVIAGARRLLDLKGAAVADSLRSLVTTHRHAG